MSWLRAFGKILSIVGILAILELIFLQIPIVILIKYVGTWAGFTYLGGFLLILIVIGAKLIKDSNNECQRN